MPLSLGGLFKPSLKKMAANNDVAGLLAAIKNSRTQGELWDASHALLALDPTAARQHLPLLYQALADADADLRQQAARAIAQYGADAAGIPSLIEALGLPSFALDEYLYDALAALGEQAVPALSQAIGHPNQKIKESAVRVLRRLGPRALPALPNLVTALSAPEFKRQRWEVVDAIAGCAEQAISALPQLRQLAQSEPEVTGLQETLRTLEAAAASTAPAPPPEPQATSAPLAAPTGAPAPTPPPIQPPPPSQQPQRQESAAASPAARWQTVNVFISSTFNDMHAERDELVKHVFPELRQWCEARRLHLVDIDLRWGVTEEDATANRRVVEVCLERIDQCRPFFLCFLGQRRGWVPRPEDIAPGTLSKYPGLGAHLGAASVTELEILHAMIQPLQPEGEGRQVRYAFFYLRQPEYLEQLPLQPPQLRATYTNESLSALAERQAADNQLTFWRQERLQAARGVHAYHAAWDAQSQTPELAYPLASPSANPANQERWRAQWRQAGVPVSGAAIAPTELPAAQEFNRRLTTGRLGHFTCEQLPLARVILEDLKQAILEQYPDHVESLSAAPLQRELEQQDQFLQAASEGFISRPGDFDNFDAYLQQPGGRIFALAGEAGTGKSTLVAAWVKDLQRRPRAELPVRHVAFRFIGASDGSTSVDALLRSIMEELQSARGIQSPLPSDPEKLRQAFPRLLAEGGNNGGLLLVLDALNQLQNGLADLSWLPYQLPSGVRLLVTFKRGEPAAEELYQQWQESGQVQMGALKPFQVEDRRRLVNIYLAQYLKELDEPVLDELVTLPGAANPLYLKIILSELRLYGVFSGLRQKILGDFGESPLSAFESLLRRLESDTPYAALAPAQAVPALFGALAHARQGLDLDELAAMLTLELRLEEGPLTRQAVNETLHLILRQVRPFLARRSGRYDFFYESFKLAAAARYTRPAAQRTAADWHALLADYFDGRPTWQEGLERQPNARKTAELPYHLALADRHQRTAQLLTDFDFLEAKISAGQIFELLQDYVRVGASRLDPAPQAQSAAAPAALFQFADLIRNHTDLLQVHPSILLQLALDQPDDGFPHQLAAARFAASQAPYVDWLSKPQSVDRCLKTVYFEGYDYVHSSALAPGDSRLFLCAWNGIRGGCLFVHDLAHHSTLQTSIRFYEGSHCAVSEDGRLLAVGKDPQQRIHLYSAHLLKELGSVGEVPGFLRKLRLSPSGRLLAAGTDGALKVWDTANGELLYTRDDFRSGVVSLAFSPDEKLIAAGADLTAFFDKQPNREDPKVSIFQVLEAHTGNCLFKLSPEECHSVNAAAFTPDGSVLVLALVDNSGAYLRAYSSATFEQLDQSERIPTEAGDLCLSSDGRWLAVTHFRHISLYQLNPFTRIASFLSHKAWPSHCHFTHGASQLVSTSKDGSLKVWDLSEIIQHPDRFKAQAPADDVIRYYQGCTFTQDDHQVITACSSASSAHFLSAWDARTGERLHEQAHSLYTGEYAMISPHNDLIGLYLALGSDLALFHFPSLASFKQLRHGGESPGWSFTPHGDILSFNKEGEVKLWQPPFDAPRYTVALIERVAAAAPAKLLAEDDQLSAVAIAPGGATFAAWSKDLRLCDLASGCELRRIALPGEERFWAHQPLVVFSPDGRWLALSDSHRKGRIVRLENGTLHTLHHARRLKFSPDGATILAIELERLLLLDAADLERKKLEKAGRFTWAEFSPDGRYLLVILNEGRVRDFFYLCEVWDVQTGAVLLRKPIENYRGGQVALAASEPALALGGDNSLWYLLRFANLPWG